MDQDTKMLIEELTAALRSLTHQFGEVQGAVIELEERVTRLEGDTER